jgi:hypothetical protein
VSHPAGAVPSSSLYCDHVPMTHWSCRYIWSSLLTSPQAAVSASPQTPVGFALHRCPCPLGHVEPSHHAGPLLHVSLALAGLMIVCRPPGSRCQPCYGASSMRVQHASTMPGCALAAMVMSPSCAGLHQAELCGTVHQDRAFMLAKPSKLASRYSWAPRASIQPVGQKSV